MLQQQEPLEVCSNLDSTTVGCKTSESCLASLEPAPIWDHRGAGIYVTSCLSREAGRRPLSLQS